MFDLFAWQHIIILLVVALVVVGPKDLPRLMHKAGKWAGKARNMANEFRKSFDEMARQAELDELRKEIDELKKNNPVSDVMNSVSAMNDDLTREVDSAIEGVGPPQTQSEPPVEGVSEPRAGEFQVTDHATGGAAAPEAVAAPAPAAEPVASVPTGTAT
jgi:sec-independent protein translocase protein TatB